MFVIKAHTHTLFFNVSDASLGVNAKSRLCSVCQRFLDTRRFKLQVGDDCWHMQEPRKESSHTSASISHLNISIENLYLGIARKPHVEVVI